MLAEGPSQFPVTPLSQLIFTVYVTHLLPLLVIFSGVLPVTSFRVELTLSGRLMVSQCHCHSQPSPSAPHLPASHFPHLLSPSVGTVTHNMPAITRPSILGFALSGFLILNFSADTCVDV